MGEAIFRLNMKIRMLRNNDEASGILFIDFKKAFDSFNRVKLYNKLRAFGITAEIFKLIEAIFKIQSIKLMKLWPNSAKKYMNLYTAPTANMTRIM